jgi:hypothetical protein
MSLILDGTAGLFGNVTGGDISGNIIGLNGNSIPVTSTESTTARSLANRFADVVNVKDFGAVGDGVTDDTAAATAAFNAANGNPVYFVDGDFNLGTSGYALNSGDGAISFTDGKQKNVWLHTRKLTGTQATGQGSLIGFSPSAYMWDTLEDCDCSDFFVGSRFRHRFLGGTTTRGGRMALFSSFTKSGTTASDNTNRNYVSSGAFITIDSDDGGTSTLSNTDAKGGHFAGSWAVYVKPSATNLLNVCGGEINIFGESGASTRYQSGISIACAYAQRGTESDAALSISGITNPTAHIGYGAGILFSSTNGRQPFASDSTIILAKAGPNNPSGIPPTVFRGIDFSEYNITDALLKGAKTEIQETRMFFGMDAAGFHISTLNGTPVNGSYLFKTKGNGAFQILSETNQNQLLVSSASIRNYTNIYTLDHGVSAIIWRSGTGSPEGSINAPAGSIYSRTDGGAGTSLYVKEIGSGNTGWVAK